MDKRNETNARRSSGRGTEQNKIIKQNVKSSIDTIRFRTSFRNTIDDVMNQRGWKESGYVLAV